MATRISTDARNAAADAVVDLLDAGSDEGYIEIRTGTQPSNVGDSASGTVLATIPLDDPAFGNASNGVATANSIAQVQASGDGTAGWFRAYDSDDNAILDGSVSVTGGGGDMQLNTTALTTGVNVQITSWTVTMPAG